jgi:hypothetical protein
MYYKNTSAEFRKLYCDMKSNIKRYELYDSLKIHPTENENCNLGLKLRKTSSIKRNLREADSTIEKWSAVKINESK